MHTKRKFLQQLFLFTQVRNISMSRYPGQRTGSIHFEYNAKGLEEHVRPLIVEYFVDYTCPFSAKIFNTLNFGLFPYLEKNLSGPFPIQFIMHQIPQPWHPQSTYVHEAALAVRKVLGERAYMKFSELVLDTERQKMFFDKTCWNLNRSEIQDMCLTVVEMIKGNAIPIDEEEFKRIRSLLDRNDDGVSKGELNYGSNIGKEFKSIVKYHRIRGVHVSPTVYVNGFEATEVSSSWTVEQWVQLLNDLGVKVKL